MIRVLGFALVAQALLPLTDESCGQPAQPVRTLVLRGALSGRSPPVYALLARRDVPLGGGGGGT